MTEMIDSQSQTLDRKIFKAAAVAGDGGEAVFDVSSDDDNLCYLRASVLLVAASAALHLDRVAVLIASVVVANKNGIVSIPAATANSVNPCNSDSSPTIVGPAQASDANSALGANPTARWSVVGTNVRLTVTNQYTSSMDVFAFVDIFCSGSVTSPT